VRRHSCRGPRKAATGGLAGGGGASVGTCEEEEVKGEGGPWPTTPIVHAARPPTSRMGCIGPPSPTCSGFSRVA
jgi:hypothetical protein